MKRKNFSFRFEWQQAIADLSPEERLEVYEQTIRYASTGRACFYSGRAEIAFNTYILPDFLRRAKAAEYRARAKARRIARQKQAEAAAKSEMSEMSVESDLSGNPTQRNDRKNTPLQTLKSPRSRHPDFFR